MAELNYLNSIKNNFDTIITNLQNQLTNKYNECKKTNIYTLIRDRFNNIQDKYNLEKELLVKIFPENSIDDKTQYYKLYDEKKNPDDITSDIPSYTYCSCYFYYDNDPTNSINDFKELNVDDIGRIYCNIEEIYNTYCSTYGFEPESYIHSDGALEYNSIYGFTYNIDALKNDKKEIDKMLLYVPKNKSRNNSYLHLYAYSYSYSYSYSWTKPVIIPELVDSKVIYDEINKSYYLISNIINEEDENITKTSLDTNTKKISINNCSYIQYSPSLNKILQSEGNVKINFNLNLNNTNSNSDNIENTYTNILDDISNLSNTIISQLQDFESQLQGFDECIDSIKNNIDSNINNYNDVSNIEYSIDINTTDINDDKELIDDLLMTYKNYSDQEKSNKK